MAEFLRVDNISKTYDGKHAVKALSLTVPSGSIYGIIGPNGAGKTTTIRMIMSIIVPDTGKVYVEGKVVGASFRNVVGYLPEERGLYKKMKVSEVIRYMAELKDYKTSDWAGESKAWLKRMALEDAYERKVEELSKGMQQKLQFITTVFHKPRFIILDELFSGLDPLNIELVKNELFRLKREGATVLFSTHVMEQAEKMCDSICMIKDGSKILDGPIGKVKASFGSNTAHISADNGASIVRSHPAVADVVEFPNYLECKLRQDADHMSLLRDLTAKTTVTKFEMVQPSLYNIFIASAGVKGVDSSGEVVEGKEAAHV